MGGTTNAALETPRFLSVHKEKTPNIQLGFLLGFPNLSLSLLLPLTGARLGRTLDAVFKGRS